MAKPLYKTTIVIWSEDNPHDQYELIDLAQEATDGSMYCSKQKSKYVDDPSKDQDWDGTDFFGNDDDDDYEDGDE